MSKEIIWKILPKAPCCKIFKVYTKRHLKIRSVLCFVVVVDGLTKTNYENLCFDIKAGYVTAKCSRHIRV